MPDQARIRPRAANRVTNPRGIEFVPIRPGRPRMQLGTALVTLLLLSVVSDVATPAAPPAGNAPATPTYDAELAKSVGADDDGMRGFVFVLAMNDIEEARQLVATDPVIQKGEMVAEYHQYFGSAALMLVNGLHEKIDRP
jgi:hypothetical protein